MSKGTVRVTWVGMEELQEALGAAGPNATRALAGALHTEGEQIMTESKRVVPVGKTGRLMSSGHVKPPEVRGTTVTVELAYGTDYAIYVHEMPASNNWTRPGSGPKYLEKPLKAAKAGLDSRLASRVKGRIF